MWRPPRALFLLLLATAGCSATPQGVGLTGAPKSRSEEPVTKNDMKSVSLRKGTLVTKHDLIADESCGGACNFRREGLGRLELEIGPNGVARASDQGEHLEEFRSSAGDTTHHLMWDRRWSGSWSEGQGEFVVELKPDATDCERKGTDGSPAEQPCQPVPLQLICQGANVPLYRPRHGRARAWVCAPDGKVVTGEGMTPFPWVFGVDRPVDMSDRRRGRRVRRYFISEPKADEEGAEAGANTLPSSG